MNTAELNYREDGKADNGNDPVWGHDITGNKGTFIGIAHGTRTVENDKEKKGYADIMSVISGAPVEFESISVIPCYNISNDKYKEKLKRNDGNKMKLFTRDARRITEMLSLVCTDGHVSDLFDNTLMYVDYIKDDSYIVITGKENPLDINTIMCIFEHTPVTTIIGSCERKGVKRYIEQHTFAIWGKKIHVITGFNVIGGNNCSDHKNLVINGVEIKL